MEGENVTGYTLGTSYTSNCLAVQAGFYSNMVECTPLDQRAPGSIPGRGMGIF